MKKGDRINVTNINTGVIVFDCYILEDMQFALRVGADENTLKPEFYCAFAGGGVLYKSAYKFELC